jgi:hypothetical protein
MTKLLLNGLPIVLGIGCAMIFAAPVALILAAIAAAIAGWLLWATKDAELGAMIGIIAAWEAVLFVTPLLLTLAVLYGFTLDLSWVLRK